MTPEAALKGGVFPLPLCWTTTEQPRENARRLHWHERTGAPLCPSEARTLASKGAIIMAQRYLPDRVELLVRPVMRDRRPRSRLWFYPRAPVSKNRRISPRVRLFQASAAPAAVKSREEKMAEPIANDWKAINDRMHQIQAERSPSLQRCPLCVGRGWIAEYAGGRHASAVVVCDFCGNPKNRPPPWQSADRARSVRRS
jgi:hypothetical protein